MARILQQCLQALGLVLRPEGGQVTTDDVALDTPVQLVFDVRREAEIGAGIGKIDRPGLWMFTVNVGAVGAGTTYGTLGLTTAYLAATGLNRQPPINELDMWLMDVVAWELDAANVITSLAASIIHPSYPGVSSGSVFELVFASTTATAISNGAGADMFGFTPSFKLTAPRYLGGGLVMNTRAVATGAGTVTIAFIVWIGPKGTTPPGVA